MCLAVLTRAERHLRAGILRRPVVSDLALPASPLPQAIMPWAAVQNAPLPPLQRGEALPIAGGCSVG